MNPTAVLDRLIGVCIDSEKRYRHAAKDVSRADLESFFDRQAELSKRTADELQKQRKHLGVIRTNQVRWRAYWIGLRWISA